MLATAALDAGGFGVEGSGSAGQAREEISRRKPDLILMDIGLPGMVRLDFTLELKSAPRTAAIPVVALTAHNMPLHERAAKAAGCQGFIAKTVTPAVLTAEVRTFLGRGKR